MDKEQFYKEFFRYLECGSCADLEFCQKQLEPACKTGLAIYRKLKMEDLEKENEQLKQSQNQIAIAELEKVKEYYISNVQWTRHKGMSILEFIDQQIKELKGENK